MFADDESDKAHVAVLKMLKLRFDSAFDSQHAASPPIRKYEPSKATPRTATAVVTLIFKNEAYLPGALTLGHSYKRHGGALNLVALVQDTPDGDFAGVTEKGIMSLLKVFDCVYGVDLVRAAGWMSDYHSAHYANMDIYATKIHLFGLLEFEKVWYLDSSTLVVQDIDPLIHRAVVPSHRKSRPGFLGMWGGALFIQPSAVSYGRALYLSQHYEEVFGKMESGRSIDEVILHYTLYNEWNIEGLDRLWFGRDRADLDSECSILWYEITKPFRDVLTRHLLREGIGFVQWDAAAMLCLQDHPTFEPYFKHIPSLRKWDRMREMFWVRESQHA